MFAYSFMAMTSYNILKPITRSKFITSFGAHNLPWVHAGGGAADRRADAPLHARDPAPAAARRGAGDAGRHRRPAVGLLGAAADRVRGGLGGALSVRPDPRHPAHQPVLDARQRRLRRAPGQARLRLHRRRRQPGRRARCRPHEVSGRRSRQRQPAAGERRIAGDLHRHRHPDPAAARGQRAGAAGRGARRGRRRGVADADQFTPLAGDRAGDRHGCRRRRRRRAAGEHGGRGHGCQRGRHHGVSRQHHHVPLARRLRGAGRASPAASTGRSAWPLRCCSCP